MLSLSPNLKYSKIQTYYFNDIEFSKPETSSTEESK